MRDSTEVCRQRELKAKEEKCRLRTTTKLTSTLAMTAILLILVPISTRVLYNSVKSLLEALAISLSKP